MIKYEGLEIQCCTDYVESRWEQYNIVDFFKHACHAVWRKNHPDPLELLAWQGSSTRSTQTFGESRSWASESGDTGGFWAKSVVQVV